MEALEKKKKVTFYDKKHFFLRKQLHIYRHLWVVIYHFWSDGAFIFNRIVLGMYLCSSAVNVQILKKRQRQFSGSGKVGFFPSKHDTDGFAHA